MSKTKTSDEGQPRLEAEKSLVRLTCLVGPPLYSYIHAEVQSTIIRASALFTTTEAELKFGAIAPIRILNQHIKANYYNLSTFIIAIYLDTGVRHEY